MATTSMDAVSWALRDPERDGSIWQMCTVHRAEDDVDLWWIATGALPTQHVGPFESYEAACVARRMMDAVGAE